TVMTILPPCTTLFRSTGSTAYSAIAAALPSANRVVVLGGVALLIVALGFKVSAVPFHFWAPDVYQGAPTTVTALMAVGIKAAAVDRKSTRLNSSHVKI